MKGVRVYLFFIFISLSIISVVVLYLYNSIDYKNVDFFKSVPTLNVVALVKINSISELENAVKDTASIRKEFFNNFLFQKAIALQSEIFKLTTDTNNIVQINNFKNRPFLISGHLVNPPNLDFLYTFVLKNRREKSLIINALKLRSSVNLKGVISGIDLFEVKDAREKEPFYFVVVNGLLTISFNKLLITQSVEQQMSNTSLLSNKQFLKLAKISEKSEFDNLYINLPKFKAYGLDRVLSSWKNQLSCIDNSDSWAEYDIDYKHKLIALNGLVVGNFDNNNFIKFFNNSPGVLSLDAVYPESVNSIFSYSFQSNTFHSRYLEFLNQHIKTESDSINPFSQSALSLVPLIDKEFGLSFEDSLGLTSYKALYIKLTSNSESIDLLSNVYQSINDKLEIIEDWKVDSDIQLPIYNGLPKRVMNNLFNPFFIDVPNQYFIIFDGYMVVSDNRVYLKRIYKNYLINNTLNHNVIYKEYRTNFSANENLFIYTRCPKKRFISDITDLSKFDFNDAIFGAQLFVNDSTTYSSVVFQYGLTKVENQDFSWKSHLDGTLLSRPTLVINPVDKEKLVVVQDSKNVLYLINSIGRIILRRPIDGQILSSVTQLRIKDKLENALIFNTSDKIYQLNFEGNNIGNYPVILPSKSCCGLSLFDYENNGDFRLFVPCIDNEIRVYDKKGNIVVGFDADKLEGNIESPIQHFVTAGKDYILYSDGFSNKILDRKGKERIQIKSSFHPNKNSIFFYLKDEKKDFFVTSNENGEVVKIAIPSGEVEVLKGVPGNGEHFFFLLQSDKDKYGYLFIANGKLSLINSDGKVVYSKELNVINPTEVRLLKDGKGEFFLSFLDKGNSQVYLFNALLGELINGFPKMGDFNYSIDFEDKDLISVITGGKDNSLINY